MATSKDPRYETIQKLFKYGEIKIWKDIFKHIPKSSIRAEIRTNHYRMKRIIDNPGELQYDEVAIIARLIGVPQRDISILIETHLKEPKRTRKA